MEKYFPFFLSLLVISILIAIATITLLKAQQYKIIKILSLIISFILFIIGLGGCFLMMSANTGSYRY